MGSNVGLHAGPVVALDGSFLDFVKPIVPSEYVSVNSTRISGTRFLWRNNSTQLSFSCNLIWHQMSQSSMLYEEILFIESNETLHAGIGEQFSVQEEFLEVTDELAVILFLVQLAGLPREDIDDVERQVVGSHFRYLLVNDLKIVGLHGFLQLMKSFGVYFLDLLEWLVVGEHE